jgi:hypothetical protein
MLAVKNWSDGKRKMLWRSCKWVIGDEKGKLLKRRLEERKEAFIFGLPLTL